ncbi:MAG: DUF1489 domain-containing protein [Alphaproteobacteria bacterium]|jgi:hypothetical protein
MALHLIKLAVGIDTIEQLQERQAHRLRDARSSRGDGRLRILTRNMPRRADEVLDGGSLYWVIRGQVCVRQAITGIEAVEANEAGRRCVIYLDPELVRTASRRSRPFQGWRYFEADNAPRDVFGTLDLADEPPPEMAAELRELGLL